MSLRLSISSSKSNRARSISSASCILSFTALVLASSAFLAAIFAAFIYFTTSGSYALGSTSFWIMFNWANAFMGFKIPDLPLHPLRPFLRLLRWDFVSILSSLRRSCAPELLLLVHDLCIPS